jgi:hypothetical protein
MPSVWHRLAGVVRAVAEAPPARAAAYLFAVYAAWLSVEYWALGPCSYVRIHDNGDCCLPARIWVGARWAVAGLWSPERLSGVDGLANAGLTGDVDTLPFLILPGWLAYGAWTWLQRFLAGYFTFRLLADVMGVRGMAAVLGGMLYAGFAQASTNGSWAGFTLYHGLGLPGLPLLAWVLVRLSSAPWRPRVALAAAGCGLALGATTSFSLSPFCALFGGAWVLVSPGRLTWRAGAVLLAFLGGLMVGDAPQVWAALVHAPTSHRADNVVSLGDAWWGAVEDVRGVFQDNALPGALAVAGLVLGRAVRPGTTGAGETPLAGPAWWLQRLSLVVAGLVTVRLVLPDVQHALHNTLGPLASFQWGRVRLLLPCLLVLAGAAGLHVLLARVAGWKVGAQSPQGRRLLVSVHLVASVAAACAAFLPSVAVKSRTLRELAGGSCYAMLYANPDLQDLSARANPEEPFRVATVHFDDLQHPAFAWAHGLESADGYCNLYPQRYQDFWGTIIHPVLRDDPDRAAYFHGWGNRVYLFTPRPLDASAALDVDAHYNMALLSLANVRYLVSTRPLAGAGLAALPSPHAKGQRAWWSTRRSVAGQLVDMAAGTCPGRPLHLYENRRALPRHMLAGSVRSFTTGQELMEALSRATLQELRDTAFVEEVDAARLAWGPGTGPVQGSVRPLATRADLITLDVKADRAAVLVTANAYHPAWVAEVDGKPARVFPVHHAFQGVRVDPGSHRVELRSVPPYALRAGPPRGHGAHADAEP